MKQSLLDVILASEKRKGSLLLLQNGPREMKDILISLDTTRQSLLPQMRILEEHYLVSHTKDTYELTPIGKLIVKKMTPIISILDVLDADLDYWGDRNLRFIPPQLLSRIEELNSAKIYDPPLIDLNQPVKELIETTASSKKMCAVTNIFHPNFMELFALWKQNSVEIHMVLTKTFFDNLKAKCCYDLQQLLSIKHFHFYVYDRTFEALYFAVNDHLLLLSMLKKGGWHDDRALISYTKSALDWGKDLFEYYLKDSTPITEI